MGRLRDIPRTAAFAWSHSIAKPSIATGTRAGAVDADFSDKTELEIFDLDLSNPDQGAELKPIASIATDSRFYDIAWSSPTDDHPEGVIAGAFENGSLDLWDAARLRGGSDNALISRTTKHTGAIKCLQFNPHKPELLATAGAKGELYITDLKNPDNAFRLGASAARADDFDCIDWNKKVAHILVTGSSGGFVTVWDVKAKKESLTLNNHGRKPVSAVAWNPDVPTKLATAIPTDQDPLILLWDLRNSSAPERTLQGHDQGVLSLSWCQQDNTLLLSCGKDNRNICWDPATGQVVGEFPIVTNWTFQTRWNPNQPSLLATASFDGKIGVQTIQNTNTKQDENATAVSQADGEDFFAKAQSQPQASTFSLSRPPKWLRRPVGVSFGFGGKIVTFNHPEDQAQKPKVRISTFTSDSTVESSIADFEKAIDGTDITDLVDSKISGAQTDESRADWRIIKTLVSAAPRKQLLSYLEFKEEQPDNAADEQINNEEHINGETKEADDDTSFFDKTSENQSFLSDLAASKGAKTNNPFNIYTGAESEADKGITQALMLGSFEKALDICLKEKRMSDAFMIAICGGQKCIDKAQAAYFAQQSSAPNYLRLLASVVGKNLWDIVYNADLANWKEVIATLCTFADENEFPDLCEALGDRLKESAATRHDASFCYLAGSKLEKVVPLWLQEMEQTEKDRTGRDSDDSEFSIHVQTLQQFIEKVTIFRRATTYQDHEVQDKTADWKLESLYAKYVEYADVVASHGHLALADQFLSLLPAQYPAAEVARNRVRQATKKGVPAARNVQQMPSTQSRNANIAPAGPFTPSNQAPHQQPNSYLPPNQYLPTQPQQQYNQPVQGQYAPPAPNFQTQPTPPPGPTAPPKAGESSNWNDLPANFQKPISRRGTPGPGTPPVSTPFAQAPPSTSNQYASNSSAQYSQPRQTAPLPPPPKVGMALPPRTGTPQSSVFNTDALSTSPGRPPSSSAYAPTQPPQPTQTFAPPPPTSLPVRGASPYNAPPASGPPSNRYAPAPGTQSSSQQPPVSSPPAPRPPPSASSYAPQQSHQTYGQPQQQPPQNAPPSGPPPALRGPPSSGPPRAGPPRSETSTPQATNPPKHPSGDRSHIPAGSMPIYQILSTEMQRVKAQAPANYERQVENVEKRLNLLFDLLNNEGSLTPSQISQLNALAQSLQAGNYDQALAIHTELLKEIDEGSLWLIGVKRLIGMSRASKA